MEWEINENEFKKKYEDPKKKRLNLNQNFDFPTKIQNVSDEWNEEMPKMNMRTPLLLWENTDTYVTYYTI